MHSIDVLRLARIAHRSEGDTKYRIGLSLLLSFFPERKKGSVCNSCGVLNVFEAARNARPFQATSKASGEKWPLEHVRASHGLAQRVFALGSRNPVHVIRHQAIALNTHALVVRLLPQQREVDHTIIVYEERILPVVPPLGNMMRQPRQNNTGNTWHA